MVLAACVRLEKSERKERRGESLRESGRPTSLPQAAAAAATRRLFAAMPSFIRGQARKTEPARPSQQQAPAGALSCFTSSKCAAADPRFAKPSCAMSTAKTEHKGSPGVAHTGCQPRGC